MAKRASFVRRVTRRARQWRDHRATGVFVISYPKCGRTWLRMLIGQLILQHCAWSVDDPMDLWAITGSLNDTPRLRMSHDDKPQKRSVSELQRDKRRYRGKRVVLLVRDPRDAIVSNFFHNSYRGKVFHGTISEYLRRPRGGVASLLEFYNIWARQRTVPRDFLLVRYELLHTNPTGTMRRIAEFIGLSDVTDETIAAAIDASSFSNMRDLEAKGAYAERRLQPSDKEDTRSYKTRKGKAGTYVEEISPDDLKWLEDTIEETLDPYYEFYRYRT